MSVHSRGSLFFPCAALTFRRDRLPPRVPRGTACGEAWVKPRWGKEQAMSTIPRRLVTLLLPL